MRLIDADKLFPDRNTEKGLAISQSQIANAETIESQRLISCEGAISREDIYKAINDLMTLEEQPCEDCISRDELYKAIDELKTICGTGIVEKAVTENNINWLKWKIDNLPSVTPQTRWIPVSERLPEDLETVNIAWVNHNPESYYMDIKDKPFTATGVYFNGQWYWWSTLCTDTLAEYSHNYYDIIDDDIEITAWMPLPQPYKAESEDSE